MREWPNHRKEEISQKPSNVEAQVLEFLVKDRKTATSDVLSELKETTRKTQKASRRVTHGQWGMLIRECDKQEANKKWSAERRAAFMRMLLEG
jgi:hypothetical protein